MKTKISQIAAVTFFALFILAGNVSADRTGKSASSHENIEEALEIEDWMVNNSIWDTSNEFTMESASEEILEIEEWMTNDKTWELETIITVETETEQTLELENWMTDENIWNN